MTYDKAYIKNLIATNDQAVARAVVAIYQYQTDVEKNAGETKENNGVGFNGTDANILSSFAEWYKAKGFLSPKQVAIARKKISKYWRQLLTIMEAKGMEVSYK